MCLLALDVDSLALDSSVFLLALGPMLISGVGGTQGCLYAQAAASVRVPHFKLTEGIH